MSSKTLARTGSAVICRFFNPFHPLPRSLTSNSTSSISSLQSISHHKPDANLYPGFANTSKNLFSSHSQQIDSEHLRNLDRFDHGSLKLAFDELQYPCGLPSLEFFLPDGNDASLNKSMLLLPKRTFQPSLIRRKQNHGFFARKETKGGHRVIARRIAKGRARITP